MEAGWLDFLIEDNGGKGPTAGALSGRARRMLVREGAIAEDGYTCGESSKRVEGEVATVFAGKDQISSRAIKRAACVDAARQA